MYRKNASDMFRLQRVIRRLSQANIDFKELGESIGINWEEVNFKPEDLEKGYQVELEHGSKYEDTNVTGDDPEMTAKIALAHLNELPDYYDRLAEMEKGENK